MKLEEQSVYTRTQLTEGGSSGCFTLGPSPVAVPPPPPFKSSPSIRKNLKFRITLCAPVCSPSSQTGVSLKVAKGVTSGPSPEAYFTIIFRESYS